MEFHLRVRLWSLTRGCDYGASLEGAIMEPHSRVRLWSLTRGCDYGVSLEGAIMDGNVVFDDQRTHAFLSNTPLETPRSPP
jgi:hypothetical protein